MAAPDKGIPQDLLAKSHCIGAEPQDRGRYSVSAEYGKGRLMPQAERTGWSAPGPRSHRGRKFWRYGGSSTDLIMLVMSERGADKLLSSKFTLGAEACGCRRSAAGRQPRKPTPKCTRRYSRGRGLSVSRPGAGRATQDLDDNKTIYGSKLENGRILTKPTRVPKAAERLIELPKQVFPIANTHRVQASKSHSLGHHNE